MSKEVPKKTGANNSRVRVLYRYENDDDKALFEQYFSRDFNISLSPQNVPTTKQLSPDSETSALSGDYSAMVLDSDQLDLQFAKAVRDTQNLFCAQLHRNIELSDIVSLLEKGLVDKFYAKPYDPNILRSDILASSLNLSYSMQSYAFNFDDEQELAVLLVDDEEVATRFLVKHLERLSCPAKLYVASSAEAALELVDQLAHKLAVVISDQRMPGMQGNQLLASLNQTNPHIIRILTSAYNEVDIALNAVNEGRIFRYIQKPWVASEINDLIKVALYEFRSAMKKAASAGLAFEQEYLKVLNLRREGISRHLLQRINIPGFSVFLDCYFNSLTELQLLPVSKGAVRAAQETSIEESLQQVFTSKVIERLQMLTKGHSGSDKGVDDSVIIEMANQSLSALAIASGIDVPSLPIDDASPGEQVTLLVKGTHPWIYKHILSSVSQLSESFIATQVDLIVLACCCFLLSTELKFEVDDEGVTLLIKALESDDG